MCSDFWFNSESVLTDGRLPTALSVIPPSPPGWVGGVYAHAPPPRATRPEAAGRGGGWCDAPPLKAKHGNRIPRHGMRGRTGTLYNKVRKKKINILQKSYIKICVYNVFVVSLQRVNKTNV